MDRTALLTTQEAIDFGPSDQHVSGTRLAVAIPVTEEALFNERFGWAFYERLRSDRYAYELTAAAPAPTGTRYYRYFDRNLTAVSAGEFVLARSVVYQCIRDVDAAGIDPANTDYYRVADRFQTTCLEQIWRRYLRGIIALAVHRDGLFSRSYRETERGAVKQYEEGKSKPLTTGELSALKSEHSTDLERAIQNMERHIKRSTGTCYADYGRLETSGASCDGTDTDLSITRPATRRTRHYGFTLPNHRRP